MNTAEPPYDIVLWGATGFTGRLVAEHLAARYASSGLSWALAGRNEKKLGALRDELADSRPGLASLPVLTGDAFDRESLEAIVDRTRVVCSTVGPYSVYGTPLVDVCVGRSTDYCDLTGEIHWIQRMIDRYHEKARANRVRIVHACGFDSVPGDLGTLMVQKTARERHGAPCSRVRAFFRITGGGMSGGTAASLVRTLEAASEDVRARGALRNPCSLAPDGEREGPNDGMQRGPRYDAELAEWTAPFLMAPVDERVVRRSGALLDYPRHGAFRYREALTTGPGLRGGARALGWSAAISLLPAVMAVGPVRRLFENHFLPQPGEGPDRERIENGSFEVRLVGEGTEPESDEPFTVEGTVAGDRDPGYGATARMFAEAAICLAGGRTDTPLEGGILTPASGIGLPLAHRLRDVGMTVAVDGE